MLFDDPVAAGVVLVRYALQSSTFVSGVSGWRLLRNGDAEFNSVLIRGGLITTNPDGSSVRILTNNGGKIEFWPPSANWNPNYYKGEIFAGTEDSQIGYMYLQSPTTDFSQGVNTRPGLIMIRSARQDQTPIAPFTNLYPVVRIGNSSSLGTGAYESNFYVTGQSQFLGNVGMSGGIVVEGNAVFAQDVTLTSGTLNGRNATFATGFVSNGGALITPTIAVGPDSTDIGRGMPRVASASTNSAAVGSTETVIMTAIAFTYRANRSWMVEIGGEFSTDVAEQRPIFRIRKGNSTAGTLIAFGTSVRSAGAGEAIHLTIRAPFTVGSADVNTQLCLTVQGSAAFNVTHIATNGGRWFSMADVGPNTRFPDARILT